MKFYDAFEMGVYNLRRTILRTILTTAGVIVGIGTLSSMISFGAGMEKNIVETFTKNDLFTSLFVTEKSIDVEAAMSGDIETAKESLEKKSSPLNDSTLAIIKDIDGVEIAFPEISFPARIVIGENDEKDNIRALPAEMSKYPPFDELAYGKFFESDDSHDMIISVSALKEMKIILKTDRKKKLDKDEKEEGYTLMPPDSVLGMKIDIVTATVRASSMATTALKAITGMDYNKVMKKKPFKNHVTKFRVSGILKPDNNMGSNRFFAGAIIPIKTSESIPRVNFSSVWDILGSDSENNKSKYQSFYVRAESMSAIGPVSDKLKEMNFSILSITDQLDEIRNVFIVIDSFLGAIGIISLFVAALGIMNTMIMSILERTREIGIMKAIGGGETDIRKIFFVEATIIGTMGGLFGLILGWIVTEIAGFIINNFFNQDGEIPIDLFDFPFWLIGGAILFSIGVSLVSALYPAYRAAKVDPVQALRHE